MVRFILGEYSKKKMVDGLGRTHRSIGHGEAVGKTE